MTPALEPLEAVELLRQLDPPDRVVPLVPALPPLVRNRGDVRIRPVLSGPAVLERGSLEVHAAEGTLEVRAPQRFLRSLLRWCDGINDMEAIAECARNAALGSGFPAFAKSMVDAGVLVDSATCLPLALRPPTGRRGPVEPADKRHYRAPPAPDTGADGLSTLLAALELQQLEAEWAARGEPTLHLRMLLAADSDDLQAGIYDLTGSGQGDAGLRYCGPLDSGTYRALADPLLLETSAALLVISTRPITDGPADPAPAWRTAFLNLGVVVDRARRWSQSRHLAWQGDIACSEDLLRRCPGSVGEVMLYAAAIGMPAVSYEGGSDGVHVSWSDIPAHHGLFIAKATTAAVDGNTAGGLLAWGRSYDARVAVHKAVSELAERAALHSVPRTTLARSGDLPHPVRPELFARYTPDQLRRLGLQAFDASQEHRWADATEWLTGDTVHIPADCVYLHKVAARSTQRPLMKLTSSGCASDVRLETAIQRAAYELIERDALARHWLAQSAARRIAPDSLSPRLQERMRILQGLGCETVVLCTSAGQCGPSLLVLVQSASRAFTCAGAACGDSAAESVERAFIEAEFAALTRCAGTAAAPISSRSAASPKDHSQLHAQRRHFRRADVLVGPVHDQVPLSQIEWPASLQARLRTAASALPLYWIELGDGKPAPATQALRTVRALIPGCIPLGFGYDALPRGMVSHPVSVAARFPHPLA